MADWGEAMPGSAAQHVGADVIGTSGAVSGLSSRFASDSSSTSSDDEDYKGPSRIGSDSSEDSPGEDAAYVSPPDWEADFSEAGGTIAADFNASFPSSARSVGPVPGVDQDARGSDWASDFEVYFPETHFPLGGSSNAVSPREPAADGDAADAITHAFADL